MLFVVDRDCDEISESENLFFFVYFFLFVLFDDFDREINYCVKQDDHIHALLKIVSMSRVDL